MRGEPEDDDPDDPLPEEDDGLTVDELELVVLVRSRVNVPESLCCSRVASTADEDGAVVPKAQITFCSVSESAGMVNASVGVVPLV